MFDITIRGVPEAQARLRACMAILDNINAMRSDLMAASQPMAALARELSPHAYEYPPVSDFQPDDTSPDWSWMGSRGTAHLVRGSLQNSIKVYPHGIGRVPAARITAATPYARVQEYGGTIYPRRARYLRFAGKYSTGGRGNTVYAKRVVLPPRPYMRPAYDGLWPELPLHVALRLATRFAAFLSAGRR